MGAAIFSHAGKWRCAPASGLSGRPGAWLLCAEQEHHGVPPNKCIGGWLRRESRDEHASLDADVSITELNFDDSYAQFGQDVYAMSPCLFAGRRNGFFVEVGAGDGEEGSTTCLMERKFGWSGICIEAR